MVSGISINFLMFGDKVTNILIKFFQILYGQNIKQEIVFLSVKDILINNLKLDGI